MSTVKIEIIHDIVCSWCAIGHKHLTDAIEDAGIDVDIRYLPYELNPSMAKEGIEIRRYFKLTHGWSDEKHDEYRGQLIKAVEASAVNIDFEYRTHYFNTHLAHRLLAEAQCEGLAPKLHASLLNAYHTHGINISEPGVLTDLAAMVGLTPTATQNALDTTQTSSVYIRAAKRRLAFPTSSVPAWIINGQTLIVGSQSRAFFRKLLQKLT